MKHIHILGDHDHHFPTKTTMKRFNNQQSYCSWEDQEEAAFAEDTAGGALGGGPCIWPPRSYSCSFCKREFRSAQALGGHMNVHRKDRALLKQTLNDQPPPSDNHHHHHQVDYKSLSRSMVALNSSQLCLPRTNVPHLSSPSKVSSSISQARKVISTNDDDVQQVQLCTGLNFTKTGRYREVETIGGGDEEVEDMSSKRCKRSDNHVALLSFFDDEFKCSKAKTGLDLKEITLLEDLDLELRLGDPTYKAKSSK